MSHYAFASTTIFVAQGLNLHLPASTAFETTLHSTGKICSVLTYTQAQNYLSLPLTHSFA